MTYASAYERVLALLSSREFIHASRTYNSMQIRALLVRNLFQLLRNLDIALRKLSRPRASRFPRLPRLSRLEFPLSERRPRRNRHPLIAAHRDNFPLHVPESGVPSPLVDGEGAQAIGPRVAVGFHDEPGWRVGYAEVEHLARDDEVVEPVHHFFDRGGEVPPVHVQQVDVAGLQLDETVLDGGAHAFQGVADVVGLEGLGGSVGTAVPRGVFCGDASGLLMSMSFVERGGRTLVGLDYRVLSSIPLSSSRTPHFDRHLL
jgi:hypothetical protein